MSELQQNTWTHQAAKRPPDRALLRFAPPSPLRGLGPSGNDPLRKRDTGTTTGRPQAATSSRQPKGRSLDPLRLRRSGPAEPHPTTTSDHRRRTMIALVRDFAAHSMASITSPRSRETGNPVKRPSQTPTQPVQDNSAGMSGESATSPQPAPDRHPSPNARTPTDLYRWGRSPACRNPATSTCGYFPLPCGHSSRSKIAAGSGPSLRCGRSAVQGSGRPVLLRPIEADRRPVTTGD